MLSRVFGLPLAPVGARGSCQSKTFLFPGETNAFREGGGTGKGDVSGFLSMMVAGGYREVKPSEALLIDMVGHGLLMPAVLQLLDVFCKCHNKKEYLGIGTKAMKCLFGLTSDPLLNLWGNLEEVRKELV